MTFSTEQIEELKKPLDRKHVASRKQGTSNVSYIEGYHAENEANRIFGFDGWDRETIETKCVCEVARKIGRDNPRDGWGVSYICRVRITVHAGGKSVIREGCGAGHGIDTDIGLAHESAIKEAETDAEKRALKTFGNQFGQALYDKTQSNVADIVETINDAQQAELQVLIEQSGMGSAKFLSSYGIEKLSDLPEKKFAPAGKRLREIIHENTTKKEAA